MTRWCLPRLAGSPNSLKIVELLKEDFEQFNFESKEQKFPVFKSDSSFQLTTKFLIMAALFGVFLILFWFTFWWSVILVCVIIVLATRLKRAPRRSKICLERLVKEADSNEKIAFIQSNLIYRLKPTKERRCNVILMAHHDSKSQSFSTESRIYIALSIAAIFLFMAVLYILCVIFEIIGITTHLWLRPLTFILGWINIGIFLLLSFNRISNKSLGALDDASGMYALWITAHLLTNESLQHCEVWIVLTGAEEIGQIGAAEFLNNYKEELNPNTTYLLNFEMIGVKNAPLKALQSYSFPIKRRISPFLFPLAYKTALELKIKFKGWYLPIGAHTDGLLFRKEGYKAINFVSREAGKFTHSLRDIYELIDPYILTEYARLNIAIIEKLDKLY
ncbi:MAG: M28 family peptidase [Candidatus Lokiarchaeota archaeon]|nr:M28 family peptidase [Candidatus Lokiarchaeota archaeon]